MSHLTAGIRFAGAVLLALCVLERSSSALSYYSTEDSQVGAYAGYGMGLPKSYGGGVVFANMAYLGYGVTNGGSSVVNFNLTARDHDWPISPILGFNFNYVDVKANDINVRGFTDQHRGTNVNMLVGVGGRLVKGFFLDAGTTFFKGQGFSPFVRLTWPIF